jgi:Tol biopolymer transport system component
MKRKQFRSLKLGRARRLSAGLTDHEHPAVSPGGRLLAYYGGAWGSLAVFVADRQGRLARRVSPDGGNNTQPAWHPDGLQLAFRHQHTSADRWELWETALTGQTEPRVLLADARWHYKHPSYDPSGQYVAYFSDEGSADIYHLWLLDLSTMERRQLTFGAAQNHCHPVFSPDGGRLAFHAYEGVDMAEPPVTNLYELELNSGEVRQLTRGEDQFKHPFYLDGTVLTLHHERNRDGRRRLEALDLRSGERVALTRGKDNDKHPFPFLDRRGRSWLAWASKRRGPRLKGEPASYDIFAARLKY